MGSAPAVVLLRRVVGRSSRRPRARVRFAASFSALLRRSPPPARALSRAPAPRLARAALLNTRPTATASPARRATPRAVCRWWYADLWDPEVNSKHRKCWGEYLEGDWCVVGSGVSFTPVEEGVVATAPGGRAVCVFRPPKCSARRGARRREIAAHRARRGPWTMTTNQRSKKAPLLPLPP